MVWVEIECAIFRLFRRDERWVYGKMVEVEEANDR